METAEPNVTFEVWAETRDSEGRRRTARALLAWREEHAARIILSFRTRAREGPARAVAVVVGAPELVERLPAGAAHRVIGPLLPLDALAADTWEGTYDLRGRTVHGTRAFAPGETVYFHGVHSGDGFERAYATGRHRDTGRYVTLISPTRRFVRWRRERVTDPVAIYHLAVPAGYRGTDPERWIDDTARAMNERAARRSGA